MSVYWIGKLLRWWECWKIVLNSLCFLLRQVGKVCLVMMFFCCLMFKNCGNMINLVIVVMLVSVNRLVSFDCIGCCSVLKSYQVDINSVMMILLVMCSEKMLISVSMVIGMWLWCCNVEVISIIVGIVMLQVVRLGIVVVLNLMQGIVVNDVESVVVVFVVLVVCYFVEVQEVDYSVFGCECIVCQVRMVVLIGNSQIEVVSEFSVQLVVGVVLVNWQNIVISLWNIDGQYNGVWVLML